MAGEKPVVVVDAIRCEDVQPVEGNVHVIFESETQFVAVSLPPAALFRLQALLADLDEEQVRASRPQ